MGHIHLDKQFSMVIRQLYAKGTVSIRELVEFSKKRKVFTSCSEGKYTDDGMISMGVEMCLKYLIRAKEFMGCDSPLVKSIPCVIPIANDEKQRKLINDWWNGKLEDYNEYEKIWDVRFKFTKEGRKLYLEKKLQQANPGTITL